MSNTMRYCLFLFAFLLSFFSSQSFAASPAISITITDEGFAPKDVTVKRNTRVIFINKSAGDRWPASNLHPTHLLYPEFDPKKPIPKGAAWSFTPQREGAWRYHDHLFPHQRGILTVVSSANNQQGQKTFLMKTKVFFTSLWQLVFQSRKKKEVKSTSTEGFLNLTQKEQIKLLDTLVREEGVEEAWKLVVTTYTGRNVPSAHDLAHFVGIRVYEKKGLSGIHLCTPAFAFGCYHGFTEAAFAKNVDALLAIEKSCETAGTVGTGPWASCIHGIGHGVATYFDTADLTSALATCDKLVNGKNFCHDGVFMEFAKSAPRSVYGSGKDPLYPCTKLNDTYKQGCARQQPLVMSKFFGMTTRDIAHTCLGAEQTIRFYCIDAIGLFVGQQSRGDPVRIREECSVIPYLHDNAQCISAAAGEIVFQKYNGWQEKAYAACGMLTETFQVACEKRVSDTIVSYPR